MTIRIIGPTEHNSQMFRKCWNFFFKMSNNYSLVLFILLHEKYISGTNARYVFQNLRRCFYLNAMVTSTYLHTGHRHVPRSQFSCRYDSRSKHCKYTNTHHLVYNYILFLYNYITKCQKTIFVFSESFQYMHVKVNIVPWYSTSLSSMSSMPPPHHRDSPINIYDQLNTVQKLDCEIARCTCMCLQSCPRAGNVIRRYVIGHLRGTLIAVCSTPSSPFNGLACMPVWVKLRLTANNKGNTSTTTLIPVFLTPRIHCESIVCSTPVPMLAISGLQIKTPRLLMAVFNGGHPTENSLHQIVVPKDSPPHLIQLHSNFVLIKLFIADIYISLFYIYSCIFFHLKACEDLLLVIQCSAGSRRLRSRPCNTDLTLGRWTNCNTNKWDWNKRKT